MKTILREVFLILVSTLLAADLLNAQSTSWSSVAASATNNLYGNADHHRDTIVAVGDLGIKLRSTDGGNSWSIISSPVGDELRSVSFLGNTDLAVGILGKILRKKMPESSKRSALVRRKNLFSVSLNNKTAAMTGEEGDHFIFKR